jgi:drug/metabolite transporter (DMT)-like permease
VSRSQPMPLAAIALIGFVFAFGLNLTLAVRGQPVLVPPSSLALGLVLTAALLVALAWPVRRAAAGERRIDPFYATRVVVLAKASALAGALLAGAAGGLVSYLLSRSVVAIGSTLTATGTLVAAVILLIAALVAEHFCRLPPDEDEKEAAAAAAS